METKRELNIADIEIASFARPYLGQRVSGDTVVIEHRDDILFLAIVDALGHGPQANAVANKAEQFLCNNWSSDVLDTMHRLHSELKGTIGAGAGLCVVDRITRKARYTGVGNTVLRTFGSQATRLISSDGIIGSRFRTPAVQAVSLNEFGIILMYTDGVSDHFDVERYPRIHYHSASAIARKVVASFGKPYDDATCMAIRYGR
ncbi:MAG: SpoIIE family protein phosphatase [Desulfobacterales bacterium]|nr:SpoIIE family protein phosphatase [Desulfobacterales bacterium]